MYAPRVAPIGVEAPSPRPRVHSSTETRLQLCEGSSLLLAEKDTDQILNRFRLQEFSVLGSTVRWVFVDDHQHIFEGRHQAIELAPGVRIGLSFPLVLRPSRHGMRVPFTAMVRDDLTLALPHMFLK